MQLLSYDTLLFLWFAGDRVVNDTLGLQAYLPPYVVSHAALLLGQELLVSELRRPQGYGSRAEQLEALIQGVLERFNQHQTMRHCQRVMPMRSLQQPALSR